MDIGEVLGIAESFVRPVFISFVPQRSSLSLFKLLQKSVTFFHSQMCIQ